MTSTTLERELETTTPPAPPVVPVGLATILGVVGAAAQYVTALVVVIVSSGDERLAAIAPLVTATATLVAVIKGRSDQAAAAMMPAPVVAPAPAAKLARLDVGELATGVLRRRIPNELELEEETELRREPAGGIDLAGAAEDLGVDDEPESETGNPDGSACKVRIDDAQEAHRD